MTPAASPDAFWAEFARLQATVLAGDAERNRAQQAADWPNLCRYKAEDATLTRGPRPRAVFLGDSITDNWVRGDPALFANGIVGRGIGGQTSPQMLARFRQDVVALRPRVVHMMAGTNDIAVENEGAEFAVRPERAGLHGVRAGLSAAFRRLAARRGRTAAGRTARDACHSRERRALEDRCEHSRRRGFSAGGHLAATLSTGFAEPVYVPVDGADAASARPFAAALIYPVVTMGVLGTHPTSRERLHGLNPPPSQVARRSAALQVGAEAPPLVLVRAIDDTAVPVSNSLNLLTAMRAAGRPVEAHLFQEGGHAFASGYPNSPTSSWIVVFDAWLARLRTSP
jgi:dienelactone hydrolase